MLLSQDFDIYTIVEEGALSFLQPKDLLGIVVRYIITSKLLCLLGLVVQVNVNIQADLIAV